MKRRNPWVGAVLALLFLAGRSDGQTQPLLETPQLLKDIQLLETINRFNFTQEQARALHQKMVEIGKHQAPIDKARREAYRKLSQDLITFRDAMLQDVPPPPAVGQRMDRELATLQKTLAKEEPAIQKLMQEAYDILTDEQKQRLETPQQQALRLQQEREQRQRRREAIGKMAETVEDLRNQTKFPEAQYHTAKQNKAFAHATQALGTNDPQLVNGLTQELVALFDKTRAMTDREFNAQRKTLREQLRQMVRPYVRDPWAGYYIMSVSEFQEFLRDSHAAQLLAERMPYLPQGEKK